MKQSKKTRDLIWLLIYAIAASTCLLASVVYEGRYSRGFSIVGTVVFLILFVRKFRAVMTNEVKARIAGRAVRFFGKVFAPLAAATEKLRAMLGIEKKRRLRGVDERSFVFGMDMRTKAAKRKLKNTLRWNEQEDNRARVRFIFIEYMIKKIKGGFFFRYSMTPAEMARQLARKEEEKLLFDTYDEARYAARADISDDTVETLVKLYRGK